MPTRVYVCVYVGVHGNMCVARARTVYGILMAITIIGLNVADVLVLTAAECYEYTSMAKQVRGW